MPDERELDELLDRALASYVDQEPDPSLRTRILARAAEAAPQRAKRLWLFAPAAACAAALVIAFLLHPSTPAPHPEPSPATSTASAAVPPAPVRAVLPPVTHPHPTLAAHRTRRSERPTLVRDASFPSPAPLTAQENILLKFATEHPDQARQLLAATATDRAPLDTKPLSIAPIHIAALSESQETQHWQ